MDRERDDRLTPDEERALASLRVPVEPSTELYGRVTSGLRASGRMQPVRRWTGPLLAAAAIVLAYMAGLRSAGPSTPAAIPGPQYAFLLMNEPVVRWPDGMTAAQVVEEFRSWAGPLSASGRLVMADELAEEYRLVDQSTVSAGDPARGINGFFVVSAPDDSAAIALARTLPHVRQGGVVTVQRLMQR